MLFPVSKNGIIGASSSINDPALPFIVTLLLKTYWLVTGYVPLKTFITPLGPTTLSASSIVWNGFSSLPSPLGNALDCTYKSYGFGWTLPVGPVGPVAPVAPVGPVAPVAPAGPVTPVGPGTRQIGIFCAQEFIFN